MGLWRLWKNLCYDPPRIKRNYKTAMNKKHQSSIVRLINQVPFLRTGVNLMKQVPFLRAWGRSFKKYIKYQAGHFRLKKIGKQGGSLKLVIGASDVYDQGWINTDVEYLNLLVPEHWETYFHKNSIDAILAEHVWEHLTLDNAVVAAKYCFEYLKPGGYLRVAVPDGYHPNPDYIESVRPGGSGPGAENHHVLYTYKTLPEVFTQAGFRVVLLEYFDADSQFHSVDWNPKDGKIYRSKRFEERNQNGELNYTSVILDAYKDVVKP